VTSYSDIACSDQCKTAIPGDGGWYMNNVHCPPWNIPEPFFKFVSHDQFLKRAITWNCIVLQTPGQQLKHGKKGLVMTLPSRRLHLRVSVLYI
jgi:hypothetical protein